MEDYEKLQLEYDELKYKYDELNKKYAALKIAMIQMQSDIYEVDLLSIVETVQTAEKHLQNVIKMTDKALE